MKFAANKKQQEAFNKVIKAIENAQKLGLVFYGKQENLVAYTKQAHNYIEEDFSSSLYGDGNQIEHLSKNVLFDSGADDYGRYRMKEDEERYS